MRDTESSPLHVNQDLFCILIAVQWLPVVHSSCAIIADSQGMVIKVDQVKKVFWCYRVDLKWEGDKKKDNTLKNINWHRCLLYCEHHSVFCILNTDLMILRRNCFKEEIKILYCDCDINDYFYDSTLSSRNMKTINEIRWYKSIHVNALNDVTVCSTVRRQKVDLSPAECDGDATDRVCATYCHWKSLTNTAIVFASLLQTF